MQLDPVIGKSILLPLLPQYPEDYKLNSFANRRYFKVSYLDKFADNTKEIMLKELI